MVCVSVRSTENNSSLAPHHPERCKGFAWWQLFHITSRPTLPGNWKVQDVDRDHQKSDCTDKAFAPYRWHPFPQDVSPPLPVLSHFQLLFWEMASMPHCHCKAPLHLPPPGTQPIFTQGQEKLEYLHYTNSGFSVRTK